MMHPLVQRSKDFAQKIARTENLRDKIPSALRPIFDHALHAALERYKKGYYVRAGDELKVARQLASKPRRSR